MLKTIGHEKNLDNLFNRYISNNLANSILIYGPKGIGKKLLIYDLIYKIISNNFNDNNLDHHLNLFNNNNHPNIKLVKKEIDTKTKKIKSNITIDQIRNLKIFVNETQNIRNFNKFIIIDSADDLNQSSSNSLLKTLEEPKLNTFIFLISHQISSLLPTLRSRCQKIKLNTLPYELFYKILKSEIIEIKDEEIKFFFETTLGSPGDAISLYDNNILETLDLTLNVISNNNVNSNNTNLIETLSKYDNDTFKNYLSILKSTLILIFKIKKNGIDFHINNSNKFEKILELSKNINEKKVFNRLEFLSKNEKDLFKLNLDKKMFLLNFITY
tara:strand:+ start:2585 stop:3568 length:984 start_codon:yes stop_codon:yes gene_type:complete